MPFLVIKALLTFSTAIRAFFDYLPNFLLKQTNLRKSAAKILYESLLF